MASSGFNATDMIRSDLKPVNIAAEDFYQVRSLAEQTQNCATNYYLG
jgi:hypothetical protein